MINNKTAWKLLALSLFIFSLVALNNVLSRGHQLVEENMLELSLAFNELDSDLQKFLISKSEKDTNVKPLQLAKSNFDKKLKAIQNEEENTKISFLPQSIGKYFTNQGLSELNFSKINKNWGSSQERINFILKSAKNFEAFQMAIENTQKKNIAMQNAYKKLIAFLVDNHFSGNKVAVVQRQPWLADRVSMRLLWLQRPLAFSPESIKALSQESLVFSGSSIELLEGQLSELATESEELKGILDELYPAIKSYAAELDKVSKIGEGLSKAGLHNVVQGMDLSLLEGNVSTMSNSLIKTAGQKIFSVLASNLLFLFALGLALFSFFNLKSKRSASVSTTKPLSQDAPLDTQAIQIEEQIEKDEYANTVELVEPIETEILTESFEKTEEELVQVETKAEHIHTAVPEVSNNTRTEEEYQALQLEIERLSVEKIPEVVHSQVDYSELLTSIEKINHGDLSVEINSKNPDWGQVGSSVNLLTEKIKQLVKAIKISSSQTALISDKRSLFFNEDKLQSADLNLLHEQSELFINRLEALNLNIKIKMNTLAPGDASSQLLYKDIEKLKETAQVIVQNLMTVSGGADTHKLEEKHAMFDNLKLLSEKMEAVAGKFNLS